MSIHRRAQLLAITALALLACVWLAAASSASARHAATRHRARHAVAHAHHSGCGRPAKHVKRSRAHAKRSSYRVSRTRSKRTAAPRCSASHSKRRHSRHAAHTRKHTPAHQLRPADDSSSCAGASLAPDDENLELVRAAILCLIDRERVAAGELPLLANSDLQQAAQSHTESMAFGDYFNDIGPGGETPAARMRAAGYLEASSGGFEVGENVAWGTQWLATPNAIVAAWMTSAGHRANILDARYRETGVGVSPHPPASLADGQPGAVYTQDFGVLLAG